MKALQYDVTVYESDLDLSHDMGQTIKEIYIPDVNIAFNDKGFLFEPTSERAMVNPIEIYVADVVVNMLVDFLKKKKVIDEMLKEIVWK